MYDEQYNWYIRLMEPASKSNIVDIMQNTSYQCA